MIIQYRQIAYYRDIQGRYYRAALGFPDEIIPQGVDVSRSGDCAFYADTEVLRGDPLWNVLEGDERVLEEKRRLRNYIDKMLPKTQPQPLYRKLP